MSDWGVLGFDLMGQRSNPHLSCCVRLMCRGSHIAAIVLPHLYRVLNQRDAHKHPVIHILSRN